MSGIDLPSFSDTPPATGPFSIRDLADFAKGESFNLLEGPDSDAPDAEALIAAATAEGRNQGFAEGLEAGKDEALAGIEAALLARLDETLNTIDTIAANLEIDRLRFLQSLFATLLPSLAERGFAEEAARALETSMKEQTDAPARTRVQISCPEGAGSLLEAAFQGSDNACHVQINEDAGLSDAALRMAWREGGLDLDLNRAINAVMTSIAAYVGENAEFGSGAEANVDAVEPAIETPPNSTEHMSAEDTPADAVDTVDELASPLDDTDVTAEQPENEHDAEPLNVDDDGVETISAVDLDSEDETAAPVEGMEILDDLDDGEETP